MVKVVIENGWEQEAKEVLLKELRERPKHIPYEWVEAWNKVKYERGWDATMLSTLVIHNGERNALDILATKLNSGELSYFYRNKVRQALLDYTEAEGTNDEIVDWYKKNKHYIYSDTKNKILRVNKEATKVPSS